MKPVDYLREACRYAAENSYDESTQNGAVLVCGSKLVYATNAFPPGVNRRGLRIDPPLKYLYTEHAERAAIYKAAATGVPTAGAILYCPWFACTDCARGIILAGIREVVGLACARNATPARWANNVDTAELMLAEAGVGMRWMAESVGITLRFDGRDLLC